MSNPHCTPESAGETDAGSRSPHAGAEERAAGDDRLIDLTISRSPLQLRWAAAISQEEWELYRTGIECVRASGAPCALGGGFALAAYTGRWRDTKDIDFYILPADRDRTVEALRRAGFEDYYSRLPYDRNWISRSVKAEVIVDIIWAMANQRGHVDAEWFRRAEPVTIRSQQLLVVPPEEFLWCKLYIVQRDHCDWTDIFNLLHAHGHRMDWLHLIRRVGEDVLLLKGLLTTYSWLCPVDVLRLPAGLWERLEMPPPRADTPPPKYNRIRLLDSRDWFAATLPEGKKLAI